MRSILEAISLTLPAAAVALFGGMAPLVGTPWLTSVCRPAPGDAPVDGAERGAARRSLQVAVRQEQIARERTGLPPIPYRDYGVVAGCGEQALPPPAGAGLPRRSRGRMAHGLPRRVRVLVRSLRPHEEWYPRRRSPRSPPCGHRGCTMPTSAAESQRWRGAEDFAIRISGLDASKKSIQNADFAAKSVLQSNLHCSEDNRAGCLGVCPNSWRAHPQA
jgi:hypothetical protein